MRSLKRICCAVDGSDSSRAALERAILFATWHGAEFHLVNVRENAGSGANPFAPPSAPRASPALAPWDLSSWEAEARAAVRGRVRGFVRAGDPAEQILAHAAEYGCDLIVLGAHARKGLRRIFFGSVAEAVWRNSECPVLVVKGPRAEVASPQRMEPPFGNEPSGLP